MKLITCRQTLVENMDISCQLEVKVFYHLVIQCPWLLVIICKNTFEVPESPVAFV
uniref:Uncharacterized protein n=1 Tax=Arundo donax TaxID=35708 RepID=A0A0A9I3J1_ARUDO